MNLSDKQKNFCEQYVLDFNATQSAIRAGYSKKTAKEQGYRLLTKAHVKDYIAELKKTIYKKYELSEENVIKELLQIAHADICDYINIDNDENKLIINDTRISNSRCISEIYTTDKGIKIKFHDKLSALTKLGEYIGMWKIKTENINNNYNLNSNLTYEEWIDSLPDSIVTELTEDEAKKSYLKYKNNE